MADDFKYDVFLSYSAKDEEVIRPLAERLRKDGLRVWFDPWESPQWLKQDLRPLPGSEYSQAEGNVYPQAAEPDKVREVLPVRFEDLDRWRPTKPKDLNDLKNLRPKKTEEGLELSRVLVLCMSAHAFGPDWADLEAGTFRFRDPLNKDRRFIPLRLDDTPIKSSLAQLTFISWYFNDREQEYAKLLDACREPPRAKSRATKKKFAERLSRIRGGEIHTYAFSPDGKRAFAGGKDILLALWDLNAGHFIRTFEGHTGAVWSVAWSEDLRYALTTSSDRTMRLWDVETGRCLRTLEGHAGQVLSAAWNSGQLLAASGSSDRTLRLWNLGTGLCLSVLEGHEGIVWCEGWSSDQKRLLSGASDRTLRLWDIESARCLKVFEGHTDCVNWVAWSTDQRRALSASDDKTIRLWDVAAGRCLHSFEGHTGEVSSVAWSPDQRLVLSGSDDRTVRLWDVESGRCLCILEGHDSDVMSVAWSPNQLQAFSGDVRGVILAWDLSEFATDMRPLDLAVDSSLNAHEQVQYTNAKVLLVGESGSGKTGLSKRLAVNDWQPSDSTVGAWSTQWELPVNPGQEADGIEREIWLWDFGGQADQRLIHQLYMNDTALAVLVFDGQKEELFETLGQWDRDLTRAAHSPFPKVLVAGRVDAGGLRVSRTRIEAFAKELGYISFLETSAKLNFNCEELKDIIVAGIRWGNIPWRSSPLLFKRLKEEIVRLKDEGRVLMRYNELREVLTLRLLEKGAHFTDEELKAVVSLLAGPCVVWELAFGGWVLLQPERINAYAQAVIQTLREDPLERGCLPEERVLTGDLAYRSSMNRLEADEERYVLLAMHQTLLERGLCLREHTDKGPLLVFPSYYRRERPALTGHPAVLVSYCFRGFLDDIYATLVVRLHHTSSFQEDKLWRYAADFRTLTGKQLGVKLLRRSEGVGELEVYFDPAIETEEKMIFSKYIHEHLQQGAKDVTRLRHYVCPHCGTPAGNREVAMRKLGEGKKDIPCMSCDDQNRRIPLWDEMEDFFSSSEMRLRVRELEEKSSFVLDNESKERALVGEVISTAALAGQISREFTVSDCGIDMEIEFKSDTGEATGRKLYLQLKSGDSYLRQRSRDGADIFTIKEERHARYWMAQAFPVLLVIRNSNGEVRWMEIRDRLRHESGNGSRAVKQMVFEGERFDVMSVRRWRDRVLGLAQ